MEGFAGLVLGVSWGPEGVRFGILPFWGSDGFSGPVLGFDGAEGPPEDGSLGLGLNGLDGFEGSSEDGSSGLGLNGLDGFEGPSEDGFSGFDGIGGPVFIFVDDECGGRARSTL